MIIDNQIIEPSDEASLIKMARNEKELNVKIMDGNKGAKNSLLKSYISRLKLLQKYINFKEDLNRSEKTIKNLLRQIE